MRSNRLLIHYSIPSILILRLLGIGIDSKFLESLKNRPQTPTYRRCGSLMLMSHACYCNKMESIRVRIRFQFPVSSLQYNRKVWMLFNISDCRLVSDLSYLIAERYGISNEPLLLHMENYLLPPLESIDIIKDNDVIDVSFKQGDQVDLKKGSETTAKRKEKKKKLIKLVSGSSSSSSSSSESDSSNEVEDKTKRVKLVLTSSSSSESDSSSTSSSTTSDGSDDEVPIMQESVGIKSSVTSSQSSSLRSGTKPRLLEIKARPRPTKPLTSSRPSTGRPMTNEPSNSKSSTSKPFAIKTMTTGKSSNPKPSVSKPSTKKPLANKPSTIKQTSKPATIKQTSKPVTNVPVASKPPTRPSTTKPSIIKSVQGSSSKSSHVYFSSDDDDQSSVMEVVEEKEKLVMKEEKDYSKYPSLVSVPSIGSVIAFKTLELSPIDYTPLLSDYKEGTVLDVTDQLLVVQLDDDTVSKEKIKAIKETEGKFSLPDAEPYEPESEISISYTDLHEAKLCN